MTVSGLNNQRTTIHKVAGPLHVVISIRSKELHHIY